MQSPKLQKWRRIRDHLQTPKIFDIFVDPSSLSLAGCSPAEPASVWLDNTKMKKTFFRDPHMPKKTQKKYVAKRLQFRKKNHIKNGSILLE